MSEPGRGILKGVTDDSGKFHSTGDLLEGVLVLQKEVAALRKVGRWASAVVLLAAVVTAVPNYYQFRLKAWEICHQRSEAWLKPQPTSAQEANLELTWDGECRVDRAGDSVNLTRRGFVAR